LSLTAVLATLQLLRQVWVIIGGRFLSNKPYSDTIVEKKKERKKEKADVSFLSLIMSKQNSGVTVESLENIITERLQAQHVVCIN
jgi:hypothetical protein